MGISASRVDDLDDAAVVFAVVVVSFVLVIVVAIFVVVYV